MSANYRDLLKYAATGIASPDMTYYDKMRASTLMGGAVQTLTGIPPLSFKSNGTPLISWSMKGNGSQTGTPTPDNPMMPEFVGVRTANLYFKKIAGANISDSGVITTLAGFDLYVAKVEHGVNYSGSGYIYAFYETEPVIGSTSYNGSRVVSNLINVASPINGFVAIRVSSTAQNIMCNTGSSVLPYEPYGWAEKITCAGQTTPVYLGQTQTVRRIKKLVLTGEEPWNQLWNSMNIKLSDAIGATKIIAVMCSHYEGQITVSPSAGKPAAYGDNCIFLRASSQPEMLIYDTVNGTDRKSFNTYLANQYAAGTPVTVWYVLAEPETAIVNEPLAKIGDFSDELYSTDAGVSIPTAKGSNTLTVDTELQPSEMTITYRG